MKLIKALYTFLTHENGVCINCMVYPDYDDECHSKLWDLFAQKIKIVESKKKIIYQDGSEYILPVTASMQVLSDRSGFIIIYDVKPGKFSQETTYPWFFEPPHNAAVYNADGSLRFQLKSPWVTNNAYIFMFQQSSGKYPNYPSVIIRDDRMGNASFFELFAVDPNNPELIPTGQEIRH